MTESLIPPDLTVIVKFPAADWSEKTMRAARTLSITPSKLRSQRYVDRTILDLARVEYLERERIVRGDTARQAGTAPLLLDFRGINALTDGVLPLLGALIAHRASKDLETKIWLPSVKPESSRKVSSVVDYICAWRFPKFIEDITGMSVDSFFAEETVTQIREWKEIDSRYLETRRDGARDIQVLSSRLVALTKIEEESISTVCSAESPTVRRELAASAVGPWISEWTVKTLGSILEKRIVNRDGNPAPELVGATILNELLVNSLIHPNPSKVYVMGQFIQEPAYRSTSPYFVLSVWDDGDEGSSLPSLLHSAAQQGCVTNPAFGTISEDYYVWYDDGRKKHVPMPPNITMEQFLAKKANAPLSAMQPGVTVNPAEISTNIGSSPAEECIPEEYRGLAGNGLHVVKVTVVRTLRGMLQYAGAEVRSSLREARRKDVPGFSPSLGEDGNEYLGKNSYREDRCLGSHRCWPLLGNLWTVWLPIKIDA